MTVQCKAKRVVINAYKDGEHDFSDAYYNYCGKSFREPFPTEDVEGRIIDMKEYDLVTIGWCSDEELYLTYEDDIKSVEVQKSKILLPNEELIDLDEIEIPEDFEEEDMQFLEVDVCTKDGVETVDYDEWEDYVEEHEDVFGGLKNQWGDEGVNDPFEW